MFYSHEVLTNRKYGVATIWLVATLGAKSSLKRITRKQMLDVDVAKACKTIVDPGAPMALRLQGNLLFGVSRVYLQQCGYVLADAQSAHNTMMLTLRSVTNHALDPDAGKARPEQLVLQDDISFLPEFALPPPELLAELGLGVSLDSPHSGLSQSLTPFGSQQSSQSSHVAGYGLVLPSSTPDQPAAVGLEGGHCGQGDDLSNIDDLLQLDDPDFTFGEDGEIIEFTPHRHGSVAHAIPAAAGASSMHSDAGAASARVRQEHEEGQQRGEQAYASNRMEVDLPIYGDDLPDNEAVSPTADQNVSEHVEVIESSSSVAAPMCRQKRSAKTLPKDTRLELGNTELLNWNTNYLQNMKEAARLKSRSRMQQRAKKNAEHYVWGAGIGGLGRDPFATQGPLNQFMGDRLFQTFTGMSRNPMSTPKRDRDSGIDEITQEEALRKRQKTIEPEEEVGRGQDDGALFMLGGDEEVELPREVAPALDDQQIFSAMPWNISASKRGSSAIPLSGRITTLSEQGRQGSRAGSRMVSASPLLRHSTGRIGDFEALQSVDSDAFEGDDFVYAALTSDPIETKGSGFQLAVRVREALSAEGGNFFAFVTEAIAEKRNRALSDSSQVPDGNQSRATEVSQITFDELLPPHATNRLVACQGFLMLLSLGTKGLLDIQQPHAFEDITTNPTEKGKAMHIIDTQYGDEVKDGDNNDLQMSDQDMAGIAVEAGADGEQDSATQAGDQEAREPDNSHFQEQMEAGHTDNDDHDSLYDSH